MTQLRNTTASTCAAQWKMWLFKVFSVLYLAAVCAAEDPAAVPPAPILEQKSARLDVFPSETAEFSCSITGSSSWTFTWYRNEEQLHPASDPNLSSPEDGSLLTVTAATPAQSGRYSCKGVHKTANVSDSQSSTSLELTVYANRPKPKLTRSSSFNPMFPGEAVTFTCAVDVSTGWEYLWYHNSQEIPGATSNTYSISPVAHSNSGPYHCKAKRGKGPFYTGDSEATSLQVSDPPTPTLTPQTPRLDVFENEAVGLSCEVQDSEWSYTWYRNGQKLEEDDDLILEEDGLLLNITVVTKTHQGLYACKAYLESRKVSSGYSNNVNVTVYDNLPKPTLSKSPAFNPMYAGETVNFTCKVDVSSGWTYQFYRDQKMLNDTDGTGTTSISLSQADAGEYSCMASRGDVTETGHSEKIRQDVPEIPVPSLELRTQWLDVFPTESVKMSCGMQSGSGWTYTWYKDTQKVQADTTVSVDSGGAALSISSASGQHDGGYECKGHLQDRGVSSSSSSRLSLSVYDKKPTVVLTQNPEYKVMFPGESVTFSCHINVSSGWEYLWYKDGSPLGGSENKHSISLVGGTNTGSYSCKAKRGNDQVFTTDASQNIHLEVKDSIPKPTLSKDPAFNPMYAGETVNFTCKVDVSSGWKYLLYKDGVELSGSGETTSVSLSQADAGEYSCKASRGQTTTTGHSERIRQDVPEIPVPSLELRTQWLDVFPTESVKMSCGMQSGSGWTYTWYKDTQKVQADTTVSVDSGGAALSISSASGQHDGGYECKGHLQDRGVSSSSSSRLTLSVYDKKPTVVLTQDPEYKVMFPGESVTFSCHITVSSGWEYLWYKDGSPLVGSENKHSISLVGGTNTGSYSCKAKRGKDQVFTTDASQDIHLEVKDKKPSVTLVQDPKHNLMHTGDSVSFSCHINVSSGWEYLWSRDGRELPISGNNHTISSVVTANTGSYKCQAKRRMITGRNAVFHSEESQAVRLDIHERPQAGIVLLTGWSEVFSTDSLVLRCEVAGSQKWNYTWFKEGVQINILPSEKHIVTPQNDPEQSLYTCQGNRTGRPSYSRNSDSFKTKNLLLKRRVLLSISGCLFFGIIAVFIGCIVLRVIRKPADDDEKPEEDNLFPTMAQLKDYSDAPCPLVEYITDATLNATAKEVDENGTICSETTPLPITSQEDQAATSGSHDTTETNGGLVSFQQ